MIDFRKATLQVMKLVSPSPDSTRQHLGIFGTMRTGYARFTGKRKLGDQSAEAEFVS